MIFWRGIVMLVIVVSLGWTATACAGERMVYGINPFGRSEFIDEGICNLDGRPLKLTRLRTRVIGFSDEEKIFSDPDTGLPVRIERTVHWPFSHEYIVEQYDQANSTMTMRRFKGNRLVEERTIKVQGPVYSAVWFPFALRGAPEPAIGWSVKTTYPHEYELTLVSIDTVKVFAGEFEAYHFVSRPLMFDIWVSRDSGRIPVKIQGRGKFGRYTMKLNAFLNRTAEPSR